MPARANDILPTESVFVGRDRLVADVTACVRDTATLRIVYVEAGEGMGKTTFLAQVRQALEGDPRVLALSVNFDKRDLGPTEADESLAIKSQRLSAYISLLRDLADQLDVENADGFNAHVLKTVATFGGSLGGSDVVIDTVADDLGRAFSRRLAASVADRHLVLILDDVHRVEENAVGTWLGAVLRRIAVPGAVIVGRAGARPHDTPLPKPDDEVRLTALSAEDIATYLKATVGAPPADEEAEVIARWTGGHPLALEIAAAHVKEHGWDSLGERDAQSGELADRLASEVEHRIATLGQKDLQAALDVAAAVRVFDRELLSKLVIALHPDAADDLTERLEAHGLVERLGESRFRLRGFLRPALLRQLANRRSSRPGHSDRTALTDLHVMAHDYHQGVLRKLLGEGAGYGAWGQLEREETWGQLVEYLYHAAHLSKERACASFALVYFDAFWWWGAKSPFPLCEILVEQGPRILTVDNHAFARAVLSFHESYPTAGEKPAATTWHTVKKSLETIRSYAALDGDPQELGGRNRHVRAITDIFLAQSHRYLDLSDATADTLLGEADWLVRKTAGDDWCLPWISYHAADLALARAHQAKSYVDRERHARAAGERANEALGLAGDLSVPDEERDHEVLSDAHRVLADVAWLRGDIDEALGHLSQAALRTYLFQAMPQPDDYTRGHLRDVAERTVARIRQLADKDELRAVRACRTLHELWTPYWRALEAFDVPPRFDVLVQRRIWDDVAASVVPAEPRRDEMTADSGYVQRVRSVGASMPGNTGGNRPGPPQRASEASSATGDWYRPSSLAAIASPVVDADLFEPRDHPVWPRAWKDVPRAWSDLLEQEDRRAELFVVLRSAIDELPALRREVLARRDIHGSTAADVSRELGISPDDQTVMLHRARAAVQHALAPYFEHARP